MSKSKTLNELKAGCKLQGVLWDEHKTSSNNTGYVGSTTTLRIAITTHAAGHDLVVVTKADEEVLLTAAYIKTVKDVLALLNQYVTLLRKNELIILE